MVDAVAEAGVNFLLHTVSSLLANEIKLIQGFENDLRKLQKLLEKTVDFLADAEMKEIDVKAVKKWENLSDAVKEINVKSVKEWLQHLEDVAFEADAVLDEINYHLLRKKLKNQKRETKEVSCSFPSSSTGFLFRKNMLSNINDLNKKFENLNKDAVSKGLEKAVVIAPDASTIGSVETNSLSIETNVIGREKDMAKIVEMVVNAPLDETVSVIPIVGMGGLGKTTLAQLVFRDEKIITHFEKRMWVCVSFNFDEVTLLRRILETLTGEDVGGIVTTEVVLQKICSGLKSKRYLLILDDVWNEDFTKWDGFMKSVTAISNATQNVIVVTAREERIALLVKTLPLYKVKGLSDDDCWSIINSKALSSGDNILSMKK